MKRILSILILISLVAGAFVIPAMASDQNDDPATTDVLILAEGSTDSLVGYIESIGGVVNYQYENVSAVAASIPAAEQANLLSYPNVTKIEKDTIINLDIRSAEDRPTSYVVENITGVEVHALDPAAIAPGTFPEGYANFLYTGAASAWGDTYAGDGSIVAVVDTGTARNTCLNHAVIGAPGYPDGYNATGDGIPATDSSNFWHGTHVGGVIASWCFLDFTANPSHPIYQAQLPYLGWGVDFVPIFGQAPEADIYPVKVFPQSGAGVPTSIILDGLDHILTLKKDGVLDIDIVNMSLGGPTLWDGRDVFDRFIEELQSADMIVVTSASNEGPVPNSVGSPATSFSAIAVGALDYAPSSRTLYEWLGLAVWPGAPGMGMVMRPTDETRVVNFSSRGPLSDGRFGPEIVALGHWNFHEGPNGELRWAGGTSFSSPTVAGAAALLNGYWEGEGYETDPVLLENMLLKGANPNVVAPTWQGINDQGYGTLDIPASLDLLMDGDWGLNPATKIGELTANILGKPVKGKIQQWESDQITLDPSEPFDAVFEIGKYTSKVTIEVYDIDIPDNDYYAFWANALEVHLQGGKRTAFSHPVNVYWYPWYGDSFDIVVEDGPWTFWGIPWDYMPMEPGLMKLTFIGDYSNESPVSFKVRVTRENNRQELSVKNRIAGGVIKDGADYFIPVDIPEGTNRVTFDLTWNRDWSKFPTSDLDLIIFDPGFNVNNVDGATANAPERAVIENPEPGTWYLLINGYEANKPDNYDLYMTLE